MPQLYVDMDGVLADFDKGYQQHFMEIPCKKVHNVNWKLVRAHEGFYADLPPMPDFEELWSELAGHDPILLTGVPDNVPEAMDNKRAWVDKHIGKHQRMIGCRSKHKCLHGKPGDILIDDWEKHKHHWLAMGGIWITHISATDTIHHLKYHLAVHRLIDASEDMMKWAVQTLDKDRFWQFERLHKAVQVLKGGKL